MTSRPAPDRARIGGPPWRPSDADRSALRAQRRPGLAAAGVLAVPFVISVAVALVLHQHSGALHDARTLVIAYEGNHPARTGLLNAGDPPSQAAMIVALLLCLSVLALLWRGWRWPSRLWRVATRSSAKTTMLVRTVTVAGPRPATYGLLWDADRDPSGMPRLAVRLWASEPPIPEARELTVLGRPTTGSVAVIVGPAGAIWPVGKLKRPNSRVVGALAAKPGR